MEYTIASLKESNKTLAFDLEKTRQWAIAAEEELDDAKAHIKDLIEQLNTLNGKLQIATDEANKAKADLVVCETEKSILLEIVNNN